MLQEGGPTLGAVARVDGDVGARTRKNTAAMLVDDKAAIKSTTAATANPTMGTRS